MNVNETNNKALLVTAPFYPDVIKQKPGGRVLDSEAVDFTTIDKRINDLKFIQKKFSESKRIDGALVTAYYRRIVPKTARIQYLFSKKRPTYDLIVGSKFGRKSNGSLFHIITYFVDEDVLNDAIEDLQLARNVLVNCLGGCVRKEQVAENSISKDIFVGTGINKTKFIEILADLSAVDSFGIETQSSSNNDNGKIVTFYKCFKDKLELEKLLFDLNITDKFDFLSENCVLFDKEQYDIVLDNIPFLVSMISDDFASIQPEEHKETDSLFIRQLPKPNDEPIIGCFDTLFEKDCYLKDYVDYERLISKYYENSKSNFIHGTIIDSILVEGNKLNPEYEDDCGYFRVKHFGIGGADFIDLAALIKGLNEKVELYCKEIKVWNISLGDKRQISDNFISVLGAELDKLSRKFDVLFVVSGTNIDENFPNETRIGSPADSLNALVVNSVVSKENESNADYTRSGPVLTFINKPDISYYGGDDNNEIFCYSPDNHYGCKGTSIAAPFIARKAAFLIHKMHLSPQCAKALIIDSACGWTGIKNKDINRLGYGIPPISIKNIIESKRDEVKIVLGGSTKNRFTMVHDFPVVIDQETKKLNYYAKLTFCYFTYGDRNKGVDYASQDISIQFGRVESKYYLADSKYHYQIAEPIKELPISKCIKEEQNVDEYKKWNNTKIFIGSSRPKNKTIDYSNKLAMWGIRIGHLDRFKTISQFEWEADEKEKLDISTKFGLVITFKTIDGSDANVEDFILKFRQNPKYDVKELDIELENRLENQLKEKIRF